MNLPLIDVVIPCYNAEQTLVRAVESVLLQGNLGRLWLIDDASTDNTFALALQFAAQYPDKISVEQMPKNNGVAMARNWGAMLSAKSAVDFVAFLDADDAYEPGALEVAAATFYFQPDTSVVRLALKPINLAQRYAEHPNFDQAWQYMRMTCGGNIVFNKAFFLACGVATLFEDVGVLHFCREGMHAERLLDGLLFGKQDPSITTEKMAEAEQVTATICRRIEALKYALNSAEIGIRPLVVERTE
ncbi:MAG: glycosyltransferase family A protein [Haemophilus parainfluenzae]|nr:glycosyltransferase family A protein [Haemophilus parainfluenzae]